MKTLIKAPMGLFFCEGHLEYKPVSQRSPDPRYCEGCCQFLEQEVSLLGAKSWLPAWAPRAPNHNQKPSVKKLAPKNLPTHQHHRVVAERPKQLAFGGFVDGN